MLLWVEQAGISAELKSLSLWFPSFSDHFPSHVSGIYLGKLIVLARILSLFVYSDANGMLGNTVGSPSFGMVTFVGHSFLNNAHSLDVRNISFLVDSHVCGQRSNSMFSEGLGCPRCLSGKEFACQCRRCGFRLWIGKILLEKMTTHSSILAGKSRGQRSLVGYSP